MRMDPGYELEEMETNMESLFDHVNSMSNTDMPRDHLASMSRHFFRDVGEKFSTFQKFQTEACLVLEQRRPHWGKRKAISQSQFLSMYYLLEMEVIESKDEVAQKLFVEIFNSREAYIESVMVEFDETDKLEKKMMSGPTFRVPGFFLDDENDGDLEGESSVNIGFDIDNFIMEVAEVIEDLDDIEKSKYVKLFQAKDGESSIGVHNSRIKALAKRKSALLNIPLTVKSYPKEVKSGTKTFTKLTASSSVGSSNTSAGYCMLINIKHLSYEARARILSILDKEEFNQNADLGTDESMNTLDDDCDLVPSQDFPSMYQSQTSETLMHCSFCEFLTRSKVDFEQHLKNHPTCQICKKQFGTEQDVAAHIASQHAKDLITCNVCGKEIPKCEFKKHTEEHERFSSFKKGLDRNPKATPKSKSNTDRGSSNQIKKKRLSNAILFL